MKEFTEDDVKQWKNDPVTKAFMRGIEVNLKDLEDGLLNYCDDNLVTFGQLQGSHRTCVAILADMKNPDFAELIELVKEQKEEENDSN